MRFVLAALLVLHGAIHAMGFLKAFGIAPMTQLQQPIGKPMGIVWLCACLLFFASAAFFLAHSRAWGAIGIAAIVLSQIAIVTSWSDARFGTIANVILLVPVLVSVLDLRSSSLRSRYEHDVAQSLLRPAQTVHVTESDLEHLPIPVRTYLRRAGVVGKPAVHDVYVTFAGSIRNGEKWMPMQGEQHNFFDRPSRYFFMEASMFGIPFDAYHRYDGPAATMQVRVLGLFEMVDAKGPEMNRSETVTMLNDMVILAPATLVDPRLQWESIDERNVRVTFTNEGNTVHAVLTFDESGDLVNFVSHDRDQSSDGKTYRTLPWSTPVRGYRDFHGVRLAGSGDAVWQQPDGEFTYARIDFIDVRYNLSKEERAEIAFGTLEHAR